MAVIPTRTGRVHFSRLARALSANGLPFSRAVMLYRNMATRPQRREAWRKVLKWARDERHAEIISHRMPTRLRRHVVVESYEG